MGISFSGDAFNDISAIKFMTKFAEIPGIKANVFLPANARPCTYSDEIENWKENLGHHSANKVISKGNFDYFKGVAECIKKSYEENKLIGTGCKIKKSLSQPILNI